MSGWLHCCVFLPWSVKICLSNELPLSINSIIIHFSQKSRDTRSHHSLIRRNENVVYNNTGIFSWPWLLPVLLAKEILKSMVRILSSKKCFENWRDTHFHSNCEFLLLFYCLWARIYDFPSTGSDLKLSLDDQGHSIEFIRIRPIHPTIYHFIYKQSTLGSCVNYIGERCRCFSCPRG